MNSKIRKNHSKTNFTGVYKQTIGHTYYFRSCLSLDPNRKSKITVAGFKTAEEASIARKDYEDKIRHELELRNNDNLSELIRKYLEWRQPSVKITTYHHERQLIDKYISLPYKNFTITQFCKENNLNNFRNKIATATNIRITQKNKIFHSLENLFKYGSLINVVSQGLANTVIIKCQRIKDTAIKQKGLENYWSVDEWKAFIKVIDPDSKWYCFFSLLGQLGCRIGEIRGLQNKHVNIKERTIRIEQQALNNTGIGKTVISTPKTKSGVRTVSITTKMMETLKDYMLAYKCKNPENFLFFNKPIPVGVSTVRRYFNYYIRIAGLPHITIHGIRHSNCTWLLSGNLDPQKIGYVSKRLGHASIRETLDIYMHIHKKEDPIIMKELEEINV